MKSGYSSYFSKTPKKTIRGTAVFMIHGVGGKFKVWSPQITFLNNYGFTVIALNLIGHGGSSKPRDQAAYTFEKMSKDVFAIFDKFMMQKNVIVGHSYGCCFAALLARQKPDYIHGLIMISGGAPIPLGPQLGIFGLPLCCLQCIKCILYREFLSRSFHKPNRNNLCHLTAITVPIFVLKNTLNGQRWDEGGVNFYSLIASPTLLIQGKKDRLISVEEVYFMKNTIKTSSLVLMENVGHMVMLESPDDLNSLIAYFMEEFLDKQSLSMSTESS
ncbi:hypothetical protein HELRODRAFT_88632 [Helobdella robusta]|uniref:acylglycerol lipase n=1 Tax=Helobdella robusta TaxID=6412 RepID=T1G746_HELRO|nr:hypothetical protein HELRODRAFT_88632 [Helobdella robusta]ESN93521.1 hypothetical protein HELRODRAFT_88632 [Helobdella robusta]